MPADGTEVAHAAPGGTDLQEVDGVGLREERLAGNLPCTGHGRKVTVVVFLGQTAGDIPAIGSGHEVAVVVTVGQATDHGDIRVIVVFVVRSAGLSRHGEILHGRIFDVKGGSRHGELTVPVAISRESAEGADGVLAEGAVICKGGLIAPTVTATCFFGHGIGQAGLADFRTFRRERLPVSGTDVIGELVDKLESLDDVGNLQAGRRPETDAVVVNTIGQQEAERVHGVTVQTCEVIAVLGDILGVFRSGTAVGTGVRTGRGISLGGRRHVQGGQDGTGVAGAGIRTAAAAIGEGEVLRDLDPLVHLIFTIVADTEVVLVSTDQDAGIVAVGEGQTALELIRTVVEGGGMTLIEGVAENLVHPVGAGRRDPGVHGRIPAGVQGDTCILGGNGPHPDFLLGREALRQVAGVADTGDEVVLHVDTLLGLLSGNDDDTAGTGSCTVDSGGGGILQDDDALDVVHGSDRGTRDAVDDPQHGVTFLGTLATDQDLRGIGRGTVVVGNHDARDLALQHAGRGSDRTSGEFLGVADDTHGSGQVLLLGLGTVTEGDGFLKDLDILGKDNVDVGASVDRNLLGDIAQAGDLKDCIGRNRDGKGTIHVRNGVGSATEDDGTHDGADVVGNGSTHCHVLGINPERCHQEKNPGEHSEQFFGKHNDWLIMWIIWFKFCVFDYNS